MHSIKVGQAACADTTAGGKYPNEFSNVLYRENKPEQAFNVMETSLFSKKLTAKLS